MNEDQKAAILTFSFICIVLLAITIIFYYWVIVPDDKLTAKWKQDVINQNKTTTKELKLLDSISCKDLKLAIHNHNFTMIEDKAISKYIGDCNF